MKRAKFLCLVLALLLMLAGCGTKTVTCDGCGKEITVKANSDVTDEWILFCAECEQAMGDIVEAQ